VEHCRARGVRPYATPFDEASVDLCVEFGFDVIKIASCSAYDWPLLQKVARTKLPVICSVGGLSRNEIDDVVDFFRSADCRLALLHCVAAYPTPLEYLQLDQIEQMRNRYPDLTVGYSGHEDPRELFVAGLAVAKGATILERHVGLPTDEVRLNAYSLSPELTEAWIREAQRASRVCANGQPRFAPPGERESLQSLRRGIYARRTIPAGKTISESDIFLAMPCLEGQFHAGKLREVVGSFTLIDPIYVNTPVGLNVVSPLPKSVLMSSIAARIRELLAEARINLDSNCSVELSHQYGFDKFFQYGAVIVDVVNRDYCKKLIIQFPNQQHPAHRHLQKEETFQIIAGTLNLKLSGQEKTLREGETQLIERGMVHSFSTETGVIFEEISTTHLKGDSAYEDTAIPSDPTTRKTQLTL
jgi:N-acetylneuraminate synthase